jgi:LuxR family transcriptional regulator
MSELTDLNAFGDLAPAGFYLAIRLGFAFPMVEHNRLPEPWVREYTISGLIVHDPAVAWAYKHCGISRWDELGETDTQGVLELARAHGLRYGAVASCTDEGSAAQRSFGLFCRSDRAFSAPELDRLNSLLVQTHNNHKRPRTLTAAELETLGLVKNGLLMKEIACMLGISESAIKQRLKNARVKLNVKTGSQAAARATMLGMI